MIRRLLHHATVATTSAALFVSTAALAQYDNDELESQITAIGVAHNLAFGPSLAPEPITGIVAGSTTYSTNLGLKYVPPVLRAPGVVGALPNSADGCGYVLTINGAATKTRQDYLGILVDYEDDFVWSNFLGAPDVYHVNTDVAVSVHRGAGDPEDTILSGTVTLPLGTHQLRWRGQTLTTPILDFPPWHLILAEVVEALSRKAVIGLKTPAARRAAMEAIIELAINIGLEGATFGLDWFLLDSVPTPSGGRQIVNEQEQTVRIFDRTPPVFDLQQDLYTLEATQVGGEFLRDHISSLRAGFTVSDTCDRRPIVNYNGPPFLPVGEITDIVWTARDAGPVDINGGFNTTQITQRILVQDTMPPILLPPPGRVIESATALSVDVGRPGVFDLADVRPVITDDAPTSFAPNTRTLVTWTATDRSGNGTTGNQWITLKEPGTNTRPVAMPQSVAARTFEPVEIELAGVDSDLLSGRFDQLSFAITDQPANGFFIAPLFPYFIEDHRVENEFGLNKFELATFLDDQCGADRNNYVPPIDFVTDPRYITVDDDGIAYVADQYFVCSRSSGRIERRNRIARFVKDVTGELDHQVQIETGSRQPDSLSIGANGDIYYLGTRVDSTTEVVRGCDPLLTSCEVYRVEIDTTINNLERLFPVKSPTSFVADANDVLYLTDGAEALVAYDLLNVENNYPAVLGAIAGVGDLQRGSWRRKDMAIDSEGNLYLSDYDNDRVYKFSASEVVRNADGSVEFTPGELVGWMGRCETNLTTFRACDEVAQTSIGYACTSARCGVTQTSGTAPGQFNQPQGIAIDANDVLYVTDHQNFRVQRFTPQGYFAGEAESECDGSCFVLGDFGMPEDVSANLQFFYVLDRERDLLHVFETTPITDFDDDTLQPTQRARVTYQSDDRFQGVDSFSFAVGDGLETSAPATVTINVTRNQRPPIATEGQRFLATEDEALDFRLAAFDPDADDQPILVYTIEESPANGALSGTGPDFTYTPDPDFSGTDRFLFSVSDGVAASDVAEAVIEVAPVNDPAVLTFAQMPDRLGAGFPIKIEVNIDDVDPTDRHVYGIDWGPGETFTSGRALPPGQVAAQGEPTFIQAADGSAVLVDEATYFDTGPRTVTVCVSEDPGVNQLASCADPRVTAVATRNLSIEPMVRKAIVITDNAPTEPGELGVELPAPAVDGDPFTMVFTVYNLEPNDVGTVLDATDVVFNAQLSDGLVIGTSGLIAITGDAVNPACTLSATRVDCTADSIPVGGSLGIAVEAVGNGQIAAETEVPVVAMVTSAEDDHNGAVGAAKSYPLSINPDGDLDGDGVANGEDAFPTDPSESRDTDMDGVGDNADAFPNDPNETVDTDGDGVGNNADTDDDNDGVEDSVDPYPLRWFGDVLPDSWAFEFVQALAQARLTGGCGNADFCPDDQVTRAQMAVFLVRGMRGAGYVAPPASGSVFSDVFAGDFAANFIEQLYADGVTGGCGNGAYCPEAAVSRAQMAVFLLRARYGSNYTPPPATAIFGDVDANYWAAAWIDQLAREGITGGCGGGNYCPDDPVSRAQMAVFLVRTFDL